MIISAFTNSFLKKSIVFASVIVIIVIFAASNKNALTRTLTLMITKKPTLNSQLSTLNPPLELARLTLQEP